MIGRRLNILFVCSHFPYPEVDHAGGTGFFHYIKSLSERHTVSLISYIQASEEKHIPSMREFCVDLEVIGNPRSVLYQSVRYPLLRVTRPKRYCYAHSVQYEKKLRTLIGRRQFDIVHIQGPWMGQYMHLVRGPKIVLDEVDVHSLVAYRQYQNTKHIIKRAYNLFEWAKTHSFELDVCQRADLVLTRSEKDRRFIQNYLPGLMVEILPPWFEGLDQFDRISPEPSEPRSLLFMGTMNRIRNAEAVLYFYEKIFPLIREKMPGLKFYIVGSSPGERVQQLARDEDVVVTGYVEDIGHYYERCAVFVAPILVGGGIIVKILNAMAAGRPVVTTPFGNEGIGATAEREIRIAQSPEEFARKTVELLQDEGMWHVIAKNGRDFAQQRYDWGQIVLDLEAAYHGLMGNYSALRS
jgi:glycosyltransferase involved in cell wall biosynthesis